MMGIVATLKVKEGKEAVLEAEVKSMMATMETAEPGCLQFDMFTHSSEPGTYVMMERYADQAAVDAHMNSAHFQTLVKNLQDVLAGPPDVSILNAVE